jgi:galactokinase
VERTLAASGYNQRRAECEEAARRLGVAALRDVKDIAAADSLPEPLRSRVRHIVSENARVLLALDCSNARDFGLLMNASHASLRDDYQVSVPELDYLVALLQAHTHVYGARMTGGGFGGACVALCEPQALQQIAMAVLRDYERAGFQGRLLVPSPTVAANGAVKASTEADKAGI